MIHYKTIKINSESYQTILRLFGYTPFVCDKYKQGGWFRLFGSGVSWTHKSVRPLFSERIGKRRKIVVGDYRYGFL